MPQLTLPPMLATLDLSGTLPDAYMASHGSVALYVLKALAVATALQTLKLSRNNFGMHTVTLRDTLRALTALRSLDLSGSLCPELPHLSSLSVSCQKVTRLSKLKALRELTLIRDTFSAENLVLRLGEQLYLGDISQLRRLDLSHCILTCTANVEQRQVADAFRVLAFSLPELTDLDLSHCILPPSTVSSCPLSSFLSKLSCLRTLRLAGLPNLSCEGLAAIAGLAELTVLSLASASLDGVAAAAELAATLPALQRLQLLDVSGVDMSADSAVAVAAAVALPSLHTLRLSRTPLGSHGGKQLAPALRRLSALTELDMSACGLGDDAAEAVALGVRDVAPCTMVRLLLTNNGCSPAGLDAIRRALRCVYSLQTVHL